MSVLYKYSMLAILVATSFLILLSSFFGFDFSDEAWILSMTSSQRVPFMEPWAYQYVLGPLWDFSGEYILIFRLIRILIYITATLLLARIVLIGYSKRLDLKVRKEVVVVYYSVSIYGAYWAWIWSANALGYNEFASSLGTLAVATFYYITVLAPKHLCLRRAGVAFSLGFVLLLIAPFKISSFLALAALFLISHTISMKSLKLYAFDTFFTFIGSLSAILVLAAEGFPWRNWLQTSLDLLVNKDLQVQFGHPLSELLIQNAAILGESLLRVIPLVIPPLVLSFFSAQTRFRPENMKFSEQIGRFSVTYWTLTIFALALAVFIPNIKNHYSIITYLSAFVLLLAVILTQILDVEGKQGKSGECEFRIATLAIIISPLMIALGTNNPITGQVSFSMSPWFVLIGIGAAVCFETQSCFSKILIRNLVAAISIITFLLVFLGVVSHPYRQAPIWFNSSQTTAKHFSGMFVTEDQSEILNWLETIGNKKEYVDKPTIAIDNPGYLFAFNNSDFASPFIASFWSVSYESIDHACHESDGEAPIILRAAGQEIPKEVFDNLAACGVTDLNDYKVSEEFISPTNVYSVEVLEHEQ